MRIQILSAAAAMATFTAMPSVAETWTADPSHTNITATWLHAGFSMQSARFHDFEGTLVFEEGAVADAEADFSVMVDSVDTGVGEFDDLLQSEQFFNSAEYPTVRFVSTTVEQTGEMSVRATGDMTMRGVTQPVVFDITVHALGEHPVGQFIEANQGKWLGMTATTTIKRSDFGMEAFIPVGSDELQIEINAELKAGGFES